MKTLRASVVVALAWLSAPAAGAQETAAAVTLDFLATAADGTTPTDLTAADLTLKIGGKARPVTSLEFIAPKEGRRHVFLLVDEATLYALEPVVKDAISKLVASLLPEDRVAYISTRRGRIGGLSADHQTAMASLASMVTGPGQLWTCLSDLARSIETITRSAPRGRGTTLAVLSRGSQYDPELGTASASGCSPRSEYMRQVGEVISDAQINVHLFTVDDTTRSWGLDTLAGNTHSLGGLLTWSNATALERAVAATSGYYRATFAGDDKAPERPQRVELKTSRPKVKLRTSPAISIRPKASVPPPG